MKGLSQEQLSEMSGVSNRTIQRIESGKTIPNGNTLKLIATALDATVDGLVIHEKNEDKGYLLLITLSAVSYLLHPFLGILIPSILWYFKRHKILYADETGRKLISFQITWQLGFFIYLSFIWGFSSTFYYNNSITKWSEIMMSVGKPSAYTISVIYFFNLFMILINLLIIQFNHKTRYFLSIPFMWKKEK